MTMGAYPNLWWALGASRPLSPSSSLSSLSSGSGWMSLEACPP
eukprot:CAMPEP_0206267280 /NCGR_PEP_ID=MMETSP0047_2-20121206/31060_1 /ASSEMBLY_ACC=CAM_ASM_000192 /TAXON_ID=195065 /ORGANISM="Chroomonas mesostigmatica_cf, Strain CCMP1168" /LENGTH=42 /DNA_ID= /DNA_START= /DNA_END= /DNA_ORIENTATION=